MGDVVLFECFVKVLIYWGLGLINSEDLWFVVYVFFVFLGIVGDLEIVFGV